MKKKVLSLLLAVVMTFSLAVTANAAEETAQDLDGDIVILHTNDVHGAISELCQSGRAEGRLRGPRRLRPADGRR